MWHSRMVSIEEKNQIRRGNNQMGHTIRGPLAFGDDWPYWALGNKLGMNRKNGTPREQDKDPENFFFFF